MNPPLGWIEPKDRTLEQNAAHDKAVAAMPQFALPEYTAGPVKVVLSDFWNKAEVVAETGKTFDRAPFHQLTGSCVGAGGGNALFTLIAVQRMLSEGATKAFVPWWPFSYGRSRSKAGMRGRGEGSLGSTFADVVVKEGIVADIEHDLPGFKDTDGLTLTEKQELDWSDGNSSLVKEYLDEAAPHPLGAAAELFDPQGIKTAVINGYPGTVACNYFIGKASIIGSGNNAACVGKWDGRGGHQQWFFGYWDNPELGPLYAIGNNWPRGTYPKDPAGLPLVCCWVKEADVKKMFTYDAEVYAFSHLNWFPAQPSIIQWSSM